jgi:hypothetical protein
MKELDTKPATGYAWAASADAARRNRANFALYSQHEINRALTVLDLLTTAFHSTANYINYRDNFISVKLSEPRTKDSIMKEQVIQLFEQQGYEIVRASDAIIVRLIQPKSHSV